MAPERASSDGFQERSAKEWQHLGAATNAANLLAYIRMTPMAIGGRLRESKRTLRHRIANAIEDQGIFSKLASRVALQLVMKCHEEDLAASSTWSDIGELLRLDAERLVRDLRLVERQIVIALPKLSAAQIEALLAELRARDPTIARTVLNAALDAADPVFAAHRYMDQFHEVLERLAQFDPEIARSFANVAFMARLPHLTAMDHFTRFRAVMRKVSSDVPFSRTVAKAACRASNPAEAAELFIAHSRDIVDHLTKKGAEPAIARSLASIASVAAEPIANACRLLERYERILSGVRATHPAIARSIALAACRFADPSAAADRYTNAYDAVVQAIERTDRRRAHTVASLAFDAADPLQAATRYLKELQQRD